MNSTTDNSEDYFKAISEEIEKEFESSAGRVDIEEILGSIFNDFCIGK